MINSGMTTVGQLQNDYYWAFLTSRPLPIRSKAMNGYAEQIYNDSTIQSELTRTKMPR